jgi:hypothetical protein
LEYNFKAAFSIDGRKTKEWMDLITIIDENKCMIDSNIYKLKTVVTGIKEHFNVKTQ